MGTSSCFLACKGVYIGHCILFIPFRHIRMFPRMQEGLQDTAPYIPHYWGTLSHFHSHREAYRALRQEILNTEMGPVREFLYVSLHAFFFACHFLHWKSIYQSTLSHCLACRGACRGYAINMTKPLFYHAKGANTTTSIMLSKVSFLHRIFVFLCSIHVFCL